MMIALFSLALITLVFFREHLLSTLLTLETMMLIVFLTCGLLLAQLNPSALFMPLVILTMSACEAALGLALMIAVTRGFNNDNLKLHSLLQ